MIPKHRLFSGYWASFIPPQTYPFFEIEVPHQLSHLNAAPSFFAFWKLFDEFLSDVLVPDSNQLTVKVFIESMVHKNKHDHKYKHEREEELSLVLCDC